LKSQRPGLGLNTDLPTLFERERERAGGGEGQREREGENLKQASCPAWSPTEGLNLSALRSCSKLRSRVGPLNN